MPSMMLSAFQRVARSGDFLVLDTETTGRHDAEIVQIAIINQEGDVLLDWFVKPTVPIPIEATAVHCIDDAMVADAFSWDEIWADVAGLLEGRNVVAYNAEFDLSVLSSSNEAALLEMWDWRSNTEWYCAMTAFAEVYGEGEPEYRSYRWQTLTTACSYFGRVEPLMHAALAGCRDALFVVNSMSSLTLS